MHHDISSIDLSVSFPNHPELGHFGFSIKSDTLSRKYALDLPHAQNGLSGALGMSISIFTGVVFATIIYNFLLVDNTNKNEKQQNISTLVCLKRTTVGSVLFPC